MTDPPGKPPKSAEAIRRALEAVQDGALAPEGELAAGIGKEDKLTVVRFHDYDAGRDFQRVLLEAGVMSEAATGGGELAISVAASDRERTAELLAEHRRRRPESPRPRYRTDWDYTLLGGIAGTTVSVCTVVGSFAGLRDVALVAASTLLGGTAGRLVDRISVQRRRTGRWQWGLTEFLILATLPALCLAVWRFAPEVLKR